MSDSDTKVAAARQQVAAAVNRQRLQLQDKKLQQQSKSIQQRLMILPRTWLQGCGKPQLLCLKPQLKSLKVPYIVYDSLTESKTLGFADSRSKFLPIAMHISYFVSFLLIQMD
jgi:hypothetical protein